MFLAGDIGILGGYLIGYISFWRYEYGFGYETLGHEELEHAALEYGRPWTAFIQGTIWDKFHGICSGRWSGFFLDPFLGSFLASLTLFWGLFGYGPF